MVCGVADFIEEDTGTDILGFNEEVIEVDEEVN
jgi:hypothetical protein